jgi:hypothetical protein
MTQRQHPRVVGTSPRNRRATNLWSGKHGVIKQLGVNQNDPDTTLDVNGAITFRKTAEPSNPDPGATVLWMDDGSYEEEGDVFARVNVLGTIKTFEIVDFVGTRYSVTGIFEEDGIEYDIECVHSNGFLYTLEATG